jgi:hypothetical protein
MLCDFFLCARPFIAFGLKTFYKCHDLIPWNMKRRLWVSLVLPYIIQKQEQNNLPKWRKEHDGSWLSTDQKVQGSGGGGGVIVDKRRSPQCQHF